MNQNFLAMWYVTNGTWILASDGTVYNPGWSVPVRTVPFYSASKDSAELEALRLNQKFPGMTHPYGICRVGEIYQTPF